ncbi:MAG: putative porphobilinogen synthase [Olpidium bornovanus]|uniref:Delta-aminolevulinic acid dehydratase n=1 Tax=Olpidium bornovanus TaxID=278681 RepID=A0A8H7ZYH3_9FUNG|nr:MAG: putative porphobilinogen synthase [Olpidium bornovanus]
MDISSLLHSGYCHPVHRSWQATGLNLTKKDLVWGVDRLAGYLEPLIAKGLASVLLFGAPTAVTKDAVGSAADDPNGPVISALKLLRSRFPDLHVGCDVCLCAYTSHGHCGILCEEDTTIDNERSVARLAEIAVAYANAGAWSLPARPASSGSAGVRVLTVKRNDPRALCLIPVFAENLVVWCWAARKPGAHFVGPSDMMDGRILTIKRALASAKVGHRVALMSYSAKFASVFYGPFRCAHAGGFAGIRFPGVFLGVRCYQLPPMARGLARRATARDVREGADVLMVKPGGPYLDIIRDTRELAPDHPIAVYQVSGECAALYHAAKAGVYDLKAAVLETLAGFQRAGTKACRDLFMSAVACFAASPCAVQTSDVFNPVRETGANIVVTYFTPELLDWLEA